MFFPNPYLVEESTRFLFFALVWTELESHMTLQQEPRFYISLESACCLFFVYSHELHSRESYDMDLFYHLKENFKNFLFDSIIMGKSFENLSYLSGCLLSQRWKFRGIRSKALWGIESDLAYKRLSGVVSQFILWSGSLWHPLSITMLKNRRIFFISNFKTNVCFLYMTLRLGVANNHIN